MLLLHERLTDPNQPIVMSRRHFGPASPSSNFSIWEFGGKVFTAVLLLTFPLTQFVAHHALYVEAPLATLT